ncbi:MAG: hypothetical protein J4428_02480 [Candidatus Aenigmarchaeota archaeon]|nr:hypothetical protein [Candidatus Aenigmarchaeota archaeon]
MNCQYCDSEVQKEWGFCPLCGHSIEKTSLFSDFLNKHVDQFKKKLVKYEDKLHGITISITNIDEPITLSRSDVNKETDHYEINRQKYNTKKMSKNVIEPHIITNNRDGILKFQICLPDVKSEEDIELQIMPNSAELRATSNEVSYFKILNVPKNYCLSEKKLDDGKLVLVFTS